MENWDRNSTIGTSNPKAKDGKIGCAVARHPHRTAIALWELAKHLDEKVRVVLPKKPNTPALEQLVGNKETYIRV